MFIAVLGLAVLSPPAAAQDAWLARYAQVSDTATLRRAERGDEQLAAGFAALRLWELTGDRREADRSRRHFDRASSQEPGNAWAHYGHALSLRAEIEQEDGTLVIDDALMRAIGMDALSRARRALERAVTIDPALPGAAELLARYALEDWTASGVELARTALEKAATAEDASTQELLALARVARQMGDHARAAVAAERAASRADALRATALFEWAAALAGLPDRDVDAGNTYFAALAAASDSLIDVMWHDAQIITRSREDTDWDAASSIQQRRDVLRAVWDVRGALEGTSGAERVAEHYARLNYAWLNHRRWGKAGAAPRCREPCSGSNALHWTFVDPRFDDQGIIYIRHGAPFAVYGYSRLEPYHVWFYRGEDGSPLSYHFVRHEGEAGWSQDYVLIRFVPCPLNPVIVNLDPRLRPLAYSCTSVRSISAHIRRDEERALVTDSDRPYFARTIPFTFDSYTFRGTGGTTEVAVAVGVPLKSIPDGSHVLQLGYAIADTVHSRAARTDRMTPRVTRRPDSNDILRTHVALSMQPVDNAAFRIDLRVDGEDDAGMIYGGTIDVTDYRGDTLMVSDIVLAEQRVEGSFERRGHALALAPTQRFHAGQVRVYYELYNLSPGGGYRTELALEPLRGGIGGAIRSIFGRRDVVTLQFEDVVPDDSDGTVVSVRDVTAPFPAGEYVLRLTIRTPDGRRIERQRRFTIES